MRLALVGGKEELAFEQQSASYVDMLMSREILLYMHGEMVQDIFKVRRKFITGTRGRWSITPKWVVRQICLLPCSVKRDGTPV
jgi:hypothetical protein